MPGSYNSRHFLYKLGDMNELRRFILESHLDPRFARAVFESLWMLEAVSINKDFLIREAGSPEEFRAAKEIVLHHWNAANMNEQLNQKTAQRVLNLFLLMEIREPGFTGLSKLRAIHDLYVHNMLDTKFLNVVNSDSTPEQAAEALNNAVAYQVQQQKTYPDLSEEEERVWNRVRVYHEFPDGFRWVYAVDDDGNIASYIPSEITSKTMNHCGNTPRAKSDDQYWELRDADGKAYLTIILNNKGELEESKSWGNQANKYRKQIQPYVKWFLMDKVKGVGPRYDYGYSTHTNFGVKDFIGDDPEFIDYVTEFKPALLGNTEEKILFWKGAFDEGIVTADQMKRMFLDNLHIGTLLKNAKFKNYEKTSRFKHDKAGRYHSSNVFGSNRFEVLCASCGGCPFTEEELKKCVRNKKIDLEEFVNYDIHLLTPEMQRIFVAADADNFDTIIELSSEIASFNVDPGLVDGLIEPLRHGPSKSAKKLLQYLGECNPREKVHLVAKNVMENSTVVENMLPRGDGDSYISASSRIFRYIAGVMDRFPDIQMPRPVYDLVLTLFSPSFIDRIWGYTARELIDNIILIGPARCRDLVGTIGKERVFRLIKPTEDFDDIRISTEEAVQLFKQYGPDFDYMNSWNPDEKIVYMLNAAKHGIDVPGIERLSPMIVTGIRNIVLGKTARNARFDADVAYPMYALGIAANPEICDNLEPGELSVFLCMGNKDGPFSFGEQLTPEIARRLSIDMRECIRKPTKALIKKLDEGDVFGLLDAVTMDNPRADIFELMLPLAEIMATVVGQPNKWYDTQSICQFVAAGHITIADEDYHKWVKLFGVLDFVKIYLSNIPPDTLFEDAMAMGCLIRVLTGHDIFCSDKELSVPIENDEIRRVYNAFGVRSDDDMRRFRKVVSHRISPLIVDGKIGVTETVLHELATNGFINPTAYRSAMEKCLERASTEDSSAITIKPRDIWKLIRSPALPKLIYNTFERLLAALIKHQFDGLGDPEQYDIDNEISKLADAIHERKNYYQIMKSIQLMEKDGLLGRLHKFAMRLPVYGLSKAEVKKRIRSLGYPYDQSVGQHISFSIGRLYSLIEYYKTNPVPEPAPKTGKRKMKDGKIA